MAEGLASAVDLGNSALLDCLSRLAGLPPPYFPGAVGQDPEKIARPQPPWLNQRPQIAPGAAYDLGPDSGQGKLVRPS
jgi:hypothetical protein